MTNLRLESVRQKLPKLNVMFWCLIALGCLEFLLMIFGLRPYIYYLHKNNAIIPSLMFFGVAFSSKPTPSAKRKLLLGALAVTWFIIVQTHRDVLDWRIHPYSWFLSTYLMAYPFAAAAKDCENIKGLKIYAYLFLAATFVLACYGLLLFLGKVPTWLITDVFYDEGSRFNLIWNPNICGTIFMIAMLLCATLFLHSKNKPEKGVLLALFFLFFFSQSLTGSRTAILITCLLLAGILFFRISNGELKRIVVGLVAAVTAIICIYSITNQIYDMHKARLLSIYQNMLEEGKPYTSVPPENAETNNQLSVSSRLISVVNSVPASIDSIPEKEAASDSPNYNYINELYKLNSNTDNQLRNNQIGSLNGRTTIWWAALRAIREDPSILIWGCEHVGDTISLFLTTPCDHSHNSWAEITLSLGLPGALISVVFTWIAFWNTMVLLWSKLVPLWKKSVALLVLGLLVAGFMEPYLFFSNQFYHYIDFTFFLCLGYVRVWVESLPRKFDTKKFPLCLL